MEVWKLSSEDNSYKRAGVDMDAADRLVEKIKDLVKPTLRPEVMSHIGGFGAAVSLTEIPCKNPVLVSSTDGVGTKLKIAFKSGIHDTVGIDLVAMCVNDIVVQGAEPLFFLDYFASGKLDEITAESVVRGIVAGCKEAHCSLVGGETAELPGMYPDGEYDLAGFAVGIVDRDRLVDGSGITVGDKIIGLGSSGIHSNGFSLVRKILFDGGGYSFDHVFPELGQTLGEALLTPTRIYVKAVLNLVRDFKVKGMAHITGGGIPGNLPRSLPAGCLAELDVSAWKPLPIFKLIKKLGNVSDVEMLKTFNCGIGMAIVVPAGEADDILDRLTALQEDAWIIGEIRERKPKEPSVKFK